MSDCYIQPQTPGVLNPGGALNFVVGSHDFQGSLIQRVGTVILQPGNEISAAAEWRIVLSQTANGGFTTQALGARGAQKTQRVPALGAAYRVAGTSVKIDANTTGIVPGAFLVGQFFEYLLEPVWLSGEIQDTHFLPAFCTAVRVVNDRSVDPEQYEFLDATGASLFVTPPISSAQVGGFVLPVPAPAVAIRTTTPGHKAAFSFRVFG